MYDSSTMEDLKVIFESMRLDKSTSSSNDPYTHCVKLGPKGGVSQGKYFVTDTKNGYTKEEALSAVCNCVSKGFIHTIMEMPEKYGPLRIDIDLETTLDVGCERQYTEDTVKSIVGFYQDEIRDAISEDEFESKMLYAIVLEKEKPRVEEGKIIKDGFHIHFPYFICTDVVQDLYFRERVTKRMIEDDVWAGMRYSNKVEKFIDSVAKKPWMMYGGCNWKDIHSTAYMYNRKQSRKPDPWSKLKTFDKSRQWGHAYDGDLHEIDMLELFEDEM